MKLTIFGATGGTGKQLIKQALAAGNQVVAFARNPSKIDVTHEHLTIVQGQLTDTAAIERAVRASDAVISVLGSNPRKAKKRKPLTQGMRNILAAMQVTGVRRLIIASTPSASDPKDMPDFKFKLLAGVLKFLKRPAYEEVVGVARLVRESDTDWTILRVSTLNNNPGSGKIRAGYLGGVQAGTNISRADLAAFMLAQVQDRTYLHQAPVLSY